MKDRVYRRQFLMRTAFGTLGSALGLNGCQPVSRPDPSNPSPSRESSRVAFNTANLVARVTGYQYELKNWMDQHQRTVALTDETAWSQICSEIADAGFSAIEIWEAHASPDSLGESQARLWKKILDDHGLLPIAYAGSLRRETLQMCQSLGIPHLDGGLGNLNPDQATRLCEEMGIPFNLENHPEKDAGEILAKIEGGNEWLGVCVDTGWLATQAAPVPESILAMKGYVRHNHIKDVKAHGSHQTCLLGEGVARVEVCLRAFQEIGYDGWYSWEDEPEDRNPFDSAARNREWIEGHLA